MRVASLEPLPSDLTPHTTAGIHMPLLRVCNRQVLKIDKTDWIDFVGRSELESWRKIESVHLVDRDLRSWSVQALNVGRRSWRPRHWFARTPIFEALWGLKPEAQLSLLETREIVVDVVIRLRWYGQGGESQAQFVDRMSSYDDANSLFDNISMYGHWIG